MPLQELCLKRVRFEPTLMSSSIVSPILLILILSEL